MKTVQKKLNVWKNRYQMDITSSGSALTIYQPFAEAIIRKIKKVENRTRVFWKCDENNNNSIQENNVIYGCRICDSIRFDCK